MPPRAVPGGNRYGEPANPLGPGLGSSSALLFLGRLNAAAEIVLVEVGMPAELRDAFDLLADRVTGDELNGELPLCKREVWYPADKPDNWPGSWVQTGWDDGDKPPYEAEGP